MDQKERSDFVDSLQSAIYSLSRQWKKFCDRLVWGIRIAMHRKTNNYQRMKYNRPYRRKQQLRAAAKHRKRRWNM